MNIATFLSGYEGVAISLILTAVVAAIPKFVPKAVAYVEAASAAQHNALLQVLVAEAVSQFKANEPAFEKQGLTLLTVAVTHVNKYLPSLTAAQVEPALNLFLQTIAKSA